MTPRVGHPLTTFRIRIEPRGFIGTQQRARSGYEAHLLRRPFGVDCITDTGGVLNIRGARHEIVLDPRKQMGLHYCRGHFRGTLTYFRTFACPAKGTCRPPKNFPDEHGVVARVAFEVR